MPHLGQWWAAGPRGGARRPRLARVCWRHCCGSERCRSATWSTWIWTPSCWSMGSRPVHRPPAACHRPPRLCARPHPPRGPAPAVRLPLAPRRGTPPPELPSVLLAVNAQVRRRERGRAMGGRGFYYRGRSCKTRGPSVGLLTARLILDHLVQRCRERRWCFVSPSGSRTGSPGYIVPKSRGDSWAQNTGVIHWEWIAIHILGPELMELG